MILKGCYLPDKFYNRAAGDMLFREYDLRVWTWDLGTGVLKLASS